jgi:hypothetical protein
VFGHVPLKRILQIWSDDDYDCMNGLLCTPRFEDFFSFTFVRNPYERIYSLAKYFDHIPHEDPKEFNSWVARRKQEWFDAYCQNQYTHIDGKQKVSFMGRHENYERDIQIVFDKMNWKTGTGSVIKNTKINTTRKIENFISIFSQESINRINKYWEADFDLLRYTQNVR